ncbi:hypothetical protein I4U23_022738 [Adineta vaga]|nr:hypothetical protein I4U23_022738 [Adineta vaga]
MEFHHYRAILFGSYGVLLVFEICFLLALSNRLLAELVERLFGIIRLDHQKLIMNFFGVHIDFLSSRRFRLSLIVQLAIIPWITVLLLVDGCVWQIQELSSQDVCPLSPSDCFLLEKSLAYTRIVCSPGEILSNSTSIDAVCFVSIYSEQNAVALLNQIGICSSIFSLICHTFKGACRMSRKWWGLIILILLLIMSIILLIVAFIIVGMKISVTAKLLLVALICLIVNVTQLRQFTYYYKRNLVQSSMNVARTYF